MLAQIHVRISAMITKGALEKAVGWRARRSQHLVTAARKLQISASEYENQRIVGVGRDLWRSLCPTLKKRRGRGRGALGALTLRKEVLGTLSQRNTEMSGIALGVTETASGSCSQRQTKCKGKRCHLEKELQILPQLCPPLSSVGSAAHPVFDMSFSPVLLLLFSRPCSTNAG